MLKFIMEFFMVLPILVLGLLLTALAHRDLDSKLELFLAYIIIWPLVLWGVSVVALIVLAVRGAGVI